MRMTLQDLTLDDRGAGKAMIYQRGERWKSWKRMPSPAAANEKEKWLELTGHSFVGPLASRQQERLTNRFRNSYSRCSRRSPMIARTPNRRLWETAFSSSYLSKRFQTGYHRDGNLKGAMTALMAAGDFKGGHLVIPRWGIAIVLRPGDLLLFDAEEWASPSSTVNSVGGIRTNICTSCTTNATTGSFCSCVTFSPSLGRV
jgi:hypothetical protein